MSYLLNSFDDHHHPANAVAPSAPSLDMAPDPLHAYPPHHHVQAESSSTAYSTDHVSSPVPNPVPKVGQTRCYWAILSADLQFIYLDPVLANHLEDQADQLVGKSILSFVHPDEQASAKQDLGGVLDSRTLHGSVTRARFSRLSKVRRQLGHEGSGITWSEAERIAVDKDYMVVDIVINWAAEGLVLCFIHAVVDLNPSDDNNEVHKTEWTNWCGTPSLPTEQVELLYHRLLMCIPQTGTMSRVFQILSNQRNRPLLISWPPDPSQGPTSSDFAKLVDNVQIGEGVPFGNDAKTSCTRRYKALQMEPVFGGEVESIFIPHGSIIFACHKVNPAPPVDTNHSASMQQVEYAPASYPSPQNASYYEHGSSYALPPLSTSTQGYSNNYIEQPGPGVQPQSSFSPQRWAQAPLPPTVSNLRSGSYSATSPTQSTQSWPSGPPSAPYLESGPPSPFNRAPSPVYNQTGTGANSIGMSPTSDIVPPPRRRISPTSSREARTAGHRPSGVQKCSSCKATSSPEWRKGPSGKKELCNACGLRYARSRAKKEGPNAVQQPQRRRKEKITAKRESATPPTTLPAYSAIRRNYADSSFSTSSTGSASGSDIYPHSGTHVVDTSPSPPTSNMNFVHYSGGSDNRPSYSAGPASSFYTLPSPLSNPHVLQQPTPTQHINTTQLPPLGQLSSYADRISPMIPSASSLTQSSLSTLPPASYERERERDNRDRDYRELPPTPLSAEPRINRRSILTHQ